MNTNTIIQSLDLASKGVWFPIVVGVVLFLFMLFMPKRMSWREVFFVFGVIGYMTWMIDMNVAKTIDLFDLGKPNVEGLGDIITYGIVPSALAVIYLNYLKLDKKWTYAVVFTILSELFEWSMVKVGYMVLKKWNPLFSVPVYFAMYSYVLPWILAMLRKEFRVESKEYEPSIIRVKRILRIKEKAK